MVDIGAYPRGAALARNAHRRHKKETPSKTAWGIQVVVSADVAQLGLPIREAGVSGGRGRRPDPALAC